VGVRVILAAAQQIGQVPDLLCGSFDRKLVEL
jgi:hypothetical protein